MKVILLRTAQTIAASLGIDYPVSRCIRAAYAEILKIDSRVDFFSFCSETTEDYETAFNFGQYWTSVLCEDSRIQNAAYHIEKPTLDSMYCLVLFVPKKEV